LIITTNYDDLMESALDDALMPYYLVIDRGDKGSVWVCNPEGGFDKVRSNKLREKLKDANRHIIYKLHGGIDRVNPDNDSFLITEQDYVDFLGRAKTCIPHYLSTRMQNASFLFLGCSLADWNVRILLRKLWQPKKGEQDIERSYAINKDPGPAEQAIWKAHGVNMYDLDLKEFVEELAEQLEVTL